MAQQATNYQCPACTGPLHFVGQSGRLECDYCGQSYEVAEIEALYAQKEQKAAEAFQKEQAKAQAAAPPPPDPAGAGPDGWDLSQMQQDWGADAAGMRAYNCPSCGAQMICDATTAATRCPYCGNNTILPGQFGGALKPDEIIPFKLDRPAAEAALKKHYGKRFLLPKTFRDANHIKEVQGVYVPFWLFDAGAEADCRYHATRSHSHTEGDYEVTVTEHYAVRRAGSMAFARVPVDGSKKMPDDYMDSIEPFDYNGIVPFSTAYLPGYLADKYDVTAKESAARADRRCESSALAEMRRDVFGYETVTSAGSKVRLARSKVRYALLPVWTLHTKWNDKDYLFMMNGQTGKMVGDLPVSKGRFWGLFGVLSAIFCILNLWLGLGQGIAGTIWG